jgi:predicted transcriptional regulator
MIVVQYILPALRVAIARELVEGHDLRKTDVAERMEVTPAAVTQYLNRSRGDTASGVIEQSSKVMAIVSEIAADLVEGGTPSDELLMKMCRACRIVRTEEIICELHKEAMPSLREIESCACSLGLVAWDLRPQESAR